MRWSTLVLTLVIIGCSGTADATRTPTRTPRPPTAVPEPTADVDTPRADAIQAYLATGFAGAVWYQSVQDVQVHRDTVRIKIPILPDAAMRSTAQSICQAVSGYVFASEHAADGLTHITVTNPAGRNVSDRRGLGGTC